MLIKEGFVRVGTACVIICMFQHPHPTQIILFRFGVRTSSDPMCVFFEVNKK